MLLEVNLTSDNIYYFCILSIRIQQFVSVPVNCQKLTDIPWGQKRMSVESKADIPTGNKNDIHWK